MHLHLRTYKSIVVIFCLAMLLSCTGSAEKKESDTKEASAETETEEKSERISLTQKQMNAVGIEIGLVEKRNLDAVVKANGQLAVPPQNKADVSILSGGIINHIYVLEGQQVKRGQTLATISNQELIKNKFRKKAYDSFFGRAGYRKPGQEILLLYKMPADSGKINNIYFPAIRHIRNCAYADAKLLW